MTEPKGTERDPVCAAHRLCVEGDAAEVRGVRDGMAEVEEVAGGGGMDPRPGKRSFRAWIGKESWSGRGLSWTGTSLPSELCKINPLSKHIIEEENKPSWVLFSFVDHYSLPLVFNRA